MGMEEKDIQLVYIYIYIYIYDFVAYACYIYGCYKRMYICYIERACYVYICTVIYMYIR